MTCFGAFRLPQTCHSCWRVAALVPMPPMPTALLSRDSHRPKSVQNFEMRSKGVNFLVHNISRLRDTSSKQLVKRRRVASIRAVRHVAYASASGGPSAKDMGRVLSESLKGISLIVVGDDSEANKLLAKALADALGYTPIITEDTMQQVVQMPLSDLVASNGPGAVGGVEYVVMQNLVSHLRCVVATTGGGVGAAARGDCWPYFFGGVTIYLDDSTTAEKNATHRDVYRQAEIQLKVLPASDREDDEWVKQAVLAALPGIRQMMEADDMIMGKKSLYIRLGCRGDWPNLKPPGWDPEKPEQMPEEM